MNQVQLQQEIAIIRDMIEKTRRETAESGHLFIALGIIWVFVTGLTGFLEMTAADQLIWPVLAVALVLTIIIAVMIGLHEGRRERVESYPRKIFGSMWISVALSAILVSFVFPFTGVFDTHLVPVFVSPILGIGFFLTGILYDSRGIVYCSLSWWIGAILMAYISGSARLYIMMGVLITGYIVPGIILNIKYRQKRQYAEN
jgi:hypothetical protein